jgi:CheY-like chemotaxis protein
VASCRGADQTTPEAVRDLKILVVEDNVTNRRVAVRMLERLGCRADLAFNGREAVSALGQAAYDVVFMDCQMPEMDGFEATVEIRRREQGARHTTIIAMTASVLDGDRDRCLVAGMDDYLTKPIKLGALAGAIRKWEPSFRRAQG